jgi:tetratricopeptide (TPR) repeat protein
MRSSTIAATLLALSLGAAVAFAQAPATAPPAPTKVNKNGPGPKSKGEETAVRALFQSQAQSPDDQIAAAEALLSKYADTDYKGFALELEAEAYQKKGDNAKAIFYGETALGADPKNYDADNLLANLYAATTKDNDLDRNEKLAKADKYAHDSLEALDAGKPALFANAPDDAWNKTKAGATEQAWQALGIAAQARKKYDEAIADFQKGIDASPDPLLMIRLGRAYFLVKKYDEAIAADQKVIDSPDAVAQYKKIAADDKTRFTQVKASAK